MPNQGRLLMAAEGGISYAAISKDHNMVEKEQWLDILYAREYA